MTNQPRWAPKAVNDKVRRQILQSGEATMMVRVEFDAGAVTAVHDHPHEQVTYVASGEMIFTIAGVDRRIPAGGSVLLPGGVPHGARCDVPTVLIDVFSPPRETFLAEDQRLDDGDPAGKA